MPFKHMHATMQLMTRVTRQDYRLTKTLFNRFNGIRLIVFISHNRTQNQMKFSGVKRNMCFGDILWDECEFSKYQANSRHIRHSVGCITGML